MPNPSFQPYKVSAVHAVHLALKATWHESSDWRIPQSYGNPDRESRDAAAAVGLQDVSDHGKVDLKGGAVEDALGKLRGVNISSVLRLKPRHALLLTPSDTAIKACESLHALAQPSTGCLHVTDVTSAYAALILVGPRADEVLSRVTALDLRPKSFPERSCAQGDLAKVHATIYRESWGALPAYLILVGRDVGEYVWTALSAAGKKLGLTPIGTTAAHLLRGPAMTNRNEPAGDFGRTAASVNPS
jgi:sarcosine oxidase subunit alpha